MFFVFLFYCDVEIPDLIFENKGSGQIWIGGNSIEDLNSEDIEQEDIEQDIQQDESLDTATEPDGDTGENP